MHQSFKAISLSFQNTPLTLREQVALNEDEAKQLCLTLRNILGLSEALVVSTCNRTEIYYTAQNDCNDLIINQLCQQKNLNFDIIAPHFQKLANHGKAVRHLFEVAAGLHSKVVGDMQIPNQIKKAYQWSVETEMAGPLLHRLLHTIFFANKRVAQETAFRDGAASVAYATVELIEQIAQNIPNMKVLIIGLGEIGQDVAENLANRAFANITLMNRTRTKADKLAAELGCRVADFESLVAEIDQADAIVSATSVTAPLITKQVIEHIKINTFKYLVDLAVPRSIELAVEDIPGVLLYNIDGIQARANEALHRRLASVPQVQDILNESVSSFDEWTKETIVSPTIQKLKNTLEQIRKDELARNFKNLSVEEAEKFDKISQSMMNKVLKLPVLQLKAACKRGEAETLIDVLNDLFDLSKQPVEV